MGGMASFNYGWFSSRITKKTVTNMKGKSPYTYNPCISYVLNVMAYTVFGKVHSAISTNLKELDLIYYIFKNEKVNTASFILACMEKVNNVKKGEIMVGRLITSIEKSLRLDGEIRMI